MLESYEQHGGLDEHYPITVRELAEQDLASFKGGAVGGKMLVDGGHRLALAFLDGQTILSPSEYRLADRGAPLINNTTILKDLFDLDDDDVYGFICVGVTVCRPRVAGRSCWLEPLPSVLRSRRRLLPFSKRWCRT